MTEPCTADIDVPASMEGLTGASPETAFKRGQQPNFGDNVSRETELPSQALTYPLQWKNLPGKTRILRSRGLVEAVRCIIQRRPFNTLPQIVTFRC